MGRGVGVLELGFFGLPGSGFPELRGLWRLFSDAQALWSLGCGVRHLGFKVLRHLSQLAVHEEEAVRLWVPRQVALSPDALSEAAVVEALPLTRLVLGQSALTKV